MSEEKKYEILPGVDLPDMKTIQQAASDFSVSGVSDIKINTPKLYNSVSDGVTERVSAEELAALQDLGDKVAADEALAKAESRKRMDAIMSTAVKAPESIVDLLNYNRDKVSEERIREKEEELRKAEELKQAEIEKERQREERRQMQQRLLEEARQRAAALREAEKLGIKPDESLIGKEPEAEEAKAEPEKVEEAVTAPVEPVAEEPAKVEDVVAAPAEPAAEEPAKTEETVQAEPVEEAPAAKEPEAKPVETKKPEEPARPAIATAEETFDDFIEFLDDGNK